MIVSVAPGVGERSPGNSRGQEERQKAPATVRGRQIRQKESARGSPRPLHFGRSQREEILGALDGALEAAEKLLEGGAAFDDVDVVGVDGPEIGGGVTEEEM